MRWLCGPILLVALTGCRQLLGIDDPTVATDASSADAPDDSFLRADASTDGAIDAAKGPLLVFVTFVSTTADTSNFTFQNVPIGVPSPDRHLIVISHARTPAQNFGIGTLEIGNDPVTKVVAANEQSSGATTALWIAPHPTGTSASFNLTFTQGGGDRRAGIGVWAAYGLQSAVARDAGTFVVDAVNPGQLTLTAPADAVFVAGVSMSSVPVGTTSTWAGTTEDYGPLVEDSLFSGASNSALSAGVHMMTHSSTDTTTSQRMVGAVFR